MKKFENPELEVVMLQTESVANGGISQGDVVTEPGTQD